MPASLVKPLAALLVLAGTWGAAFGLAFWIIGSSPPNLPSEAVAGCGELLVDADGGPAFHASSTRVVLALDEDWRFLYGERAVATARRLLTEASGLFRSTHIHLLAVRVADWSSPDEMDSASTLLSVVERDVGLGDGDIVIALTAQPLRGRDGVARRRGRYALVKHHPGRLDRDALVLAHEVAHLFGANHECDLPGKSGLMAERGFSEERLICPCTQRVLEANAARFHRDLEDER